MMREDFMFGPKTDPYNPVFADKPNCKKWWQRMKDRPSYDKAPILTTLLTSKYAKDNDTYIWYDKDGNLVESREYNGPVWKPKEDAKYEQDESGDEKEKDV